MKFQENLREVKLLFPTPAPARMQAEKSANVKFTLTQEQAE